MSSPPLNESWNPVGPFSGQFVPQPIRVGPRPGPDPSSSPQELRLGSLAFLSRPATARGESPWRRSRPPRPAHRDSRLAGPSCAQLGHATFRVRPDSVHFAACRAAWCLRPSPSTSLAVPRIVSRRRLTPIPDRSHPQELFVCPHEASCYFRAIFLVNDG